MNKDIILEFLNSKLTNNTVNFYWGNTRKLKNNANLELGLKEIVILNNKELLNDEEIKTTRSNFTNHIYPNVLDEELQMDVILDLLIDEKVQQSLDKNPLYTSLVALKNIISNYTSNINKRYTISNVLMNDMSIQDVEKYNLMYNKERTLSEREIKLLILKDYEHLLPEEEVNFYKEMFKQQLALRKVTKDEVIDAIYTDYDPIDLNGPYIYSLVYDDFIHTQEEVNAKYRLKILMANKHMFNIDEYEVHFNNINNELILAAENKKTFI